MKTAVRVYVYKPNVRVRFLQAPIYIMSGFDVNSLIQALFPIDQRQDVEFCLAEETRHLTGDVFAALPRRKKTSNLVHKIP